jgi:hypothetical protein
MKVRFVPADFAILGTQNLHPTTKRSADRRDMVTDAQFETQSTMRRFIFLATVVSGFVAAYLMYRRGESLMSIARRAVTNPVGSLVSEVKKAV